MSEEFLGVLLMGRGSSRKVEFYRQNGECEPRITYREIMDHTGKLGRTGEISTDIMEEEYGSFDNYRKAVADSLR